MPGDLRVRTLDDELIARLKRRAVRHGRSADAELREILRHVLATEGEPTFQTLAAELRGLTRDASKLRPTFCFVKPVRNVKALVVDASVAVKWVVEVGSAPLALRERGRSIAPEL